MKHLSLPHLGYLEATKDPLNEISVTDYKSTTQVLFATEQPPGGEIFYGMNFFV